ncbi:hypothetical protein PISMIDRAFT_116870 [Pisolithus microcarpus 441]|uniref:Uncharacterized protein n=1 Tax=Pisolithus microcarpus 441 TaxID=765257 RepID=A0A0C9YL60_9AGAM|nr:hypothetical protein PISMIDRAFT_116870 [Pisolithus microcarpus 441]
MSSPSPTRELEKQHAFTVALTVYSSLKKNTKGKAPAPKEVKSVKMKELFFPLREDNYLTFLQRILEKHGQDQYKVSVHKRYSFKFVLPKHTISDAMDIDNEIDYKEMVKKLRRNASSTTKVLVDMKQVEKLPSSESGDETSDASDGDDDPVCPLRCTEIITHFTCRNLCLKELEILTPALLDGESNSSSCTRTSTMRDSHMSDPWALCRQLKAENAQPLDNAL